MFYIQLLNGIKNLDNASIMRSGVALLVCLLCSCFLAIDIGRSLGPCRNQHSASN
jgi:hypothetical protein